MNYDQLDLSELRNVCEQLNRDGYHATLSDIYGAANSNAIFASPGSKEEHRAVAFGAITEPMNAVKLIKVLFAMFNCEYTDVKISIHDNGTWSIGSDSRSTLYVGHRNVATAILVILEQDPSCRRSLVNEIHKRVRANPPFLSVRDKTIQRIKEVGHRWQSKAYELEKKAQDPGITGGERSCYEDEANTIHKIALEFLNAVDNSIEQELTEENS